VTQNRLVRELLPDASMVSAHPRVTAETILRFADLRPGPDSTLVTRDTPLLRIVAPLLLGLPVTAERIAAEDLNRLVVFDAGARPAMDALIELAGDPKYEAKLLEIEQTSGDTNVWSSQGQLYFVANPTTGQDEIARRRTLLAAEPRLSTIPRQLVQAYGRQRGTASQSPPAFDPGEDAKAATAVRIEAAEDYASRRRFAKVDVLIHVWADLGVYLNFDRPRLLALERAATSGDMTEEWRVRLQRDERLFRFLRLRPYFEELYPSEVKRAAAVAQQPAASGPPPVQPAAAATPPPVPAPPSAPAEETVRSIPQTAEPTPPALVDLRVPDADTVVLRMEPTSVTRLFKAAAWDSNGPIASWTADVEAGNAIGPEVREAGEADLQTAGRLLFRSVFRNAIGERIEAMLRKRLRLVIDVSEGAEAVSGLPWEALSPDTSPPALDGRLQVIRYLRSQTPSRILAGDDVMRMLAIIPSPKDLALIGEGEARSVLDLVLKPAVERRLLRYEMLTGEITREQLHDVMKEQRPNIFHFFGHSSVDRPSDEGGVYLGAGRGEYVGAGSVARFFTNTGAGGRLAVLLGAETGSGREKGVQNSVAGRLVIAGVPAVIGTLRVITIQSALLFSQRFYSALLEDGDVERALTEARKALAREKWDWSAFALFSNAAAIPRLPFRSGVA
jgi:CHAT domain